MLFSGGLAPRRLHCCAGDDPKHQPTGGRKAGAALHGRVHGGQQAIVGAQSVILAADATGYGKASDSLLTSPGYATTDSNGDFTITGDYTCPSAREHAGVSLFNWR